MSSTIGSYDMTCSDSRPAPSSAKGLREEYAAMMKNSAAMVTMKALISRLPPLKKMPPAKATNTSAQVMYMPSTPDTVTSSFAMSLRTS